MAYFLTLPVLALCLILCFVPTKQETDNTNEDVITARTPSKIAAQRKEFGCTFETDTFFNPYKTKNTDTPIWEKKPSNGIYISSDHNDAAPLSPTKKYIHPHVAPVGQAAKVPIEDKVLNTREWNLFKSDVQKSFAVILEKHHFLNDVDPFISFLKAYNGETVKRKREKMEKISIESFLNEYNVPFSPRENPAGLIIYLFHEIDRRVNVTANLEPYLVTAYVDPPALDVSNVKKGYEDLTKTRFQDHVGGVIQIYYENRLGYILFEPGYYNTYLITPFVVVLMADEKYPHGEFIFGEKLNGTTFTMGDPSDMYVVAFYPRQTGVKNMVYYLGRAYCSFLESTTKGDLLRSEHGIVSFDKYGRGWGHLSFNINCPKYFKMGEWRLREKELYPQLSYESMSFEHFHSGKLSLTEKNAVKKFSDSLLLTLGSTTREIQFLTEEFFYAPPNMTQYEEFKQELTTLSNKYKLEKLVNANTSMLYTNRNPSMLKRVVSKLI